MNLRSQWSSRVTAREAPPRSPSLVQRVVDVEGLRTAYLEEHSPTRQHPVVLVPGLGMSTTSLRRVMPYLAADHHVLAVDPPGQGRSADPDHVLTLNELVDHLVTWADRVGVQQADWVGHSLGGLVIAHLAVRHPKRVRRLALVACPPDPRTPTPWHLASRLVLDGVVEHPRVIGYAVRDYLRTGPLTMWRMLSRTVTVEAAPTLARVRVPTLVVRGALDPVVDRQWADRMTAMIPGSTQVTIPLGTHGLPGQSPHQLGPVLRDFFA